ncbi:MAG: hypothetical protein AAGF97_05530 [Planctomycetota bacterium]
MSADSILMRLEALRAGRQGPFLLGVAGCDLGTTTTDVASTLAASAAKRQTGRVLLVRCHGGDDHPGPGLGELLRGKATISEVIRIADDELDVLPAGNLQRETLAPAAVLSTLQSVAAPYQLVVLDLPAVSEEAPSLVFNPSVHGVALVIDARKTRIREAQAAHRILQENQVEVLGTILTRVRPTLPRFLDRWF